MKKDHKTIRTTAAQRAARRKNAAKATEAREKAIEARRADAAARLVAAGVPEVAMSEAKLAAAKVQRAELELAEKRGQLVRVEDVEARWAEIVTTVRNHVLGIPSKLTLRLPPDDAHRKVVRIVDELIRSSLEELADGDEAKP